MSNEKWVFPSYDDPIEDPQFNAPSNTAEDSFKLPDYAEGISPSEAFAIGIGEGMTSAGRGIADLGLAAGEMLGIDSAAKAREELRQRIAEEKKFFNAGVANELSPISGWAGGGQFVGEIAPSLLIPGATSKSLVGRMLQNAGMQGLYEGAANTNHGEGLLTGAIGGAAGSGIVDLLGKGVSGAMGHYIDPNIRAMQQKLRAAGMKPQVGDLAPLTESSWIRAAEDVYSRIPPGRNRLVKEGEKLRRVIVPDKMTGTNVVTHAINQTDEGVKALSGQIWEPFEQAIQGNVTNVRPVGLQRGLKQVLDHYDQVFTPSVIPDKALRERLISIAEADPKKLQSIPIAEYHELRKALGSALAGVKIMATPAAAGAPARLDKKAVGMFKNLYKESSDDIARWGNNGKNQKAYRLFESANKDWQEKVLPWQENPLAKELAEVGDKLGAPKSASLIAKETDTDAIDQMRRYMAKYGPYDSTDVIDALATQRRAANTLTGFGADVQPEGSVLSVGIAPWLAGPAHGIAAMSDKPAFQNLYFGDSSWLRPQGGLATANMVRNIPLAAMREASSDNNVGLTTAYGLADLLGMVGGEDDDETYSHGIGHATQEGVAGR